MRLLVIDTETGGLDAARHALLEVAVVVYDTDTREEVEVYERRVLPLGGLDIDPQAAAVNGYTVDAWEGASLEIMVARDLGALIRRHPGALVCGHNVRFDLQFLQALFARKGFPFSVSHRVIDTQSLSAFDLLEGNVTSTSLTAMCDFYGIERPAVHRALADVRATIALLEALRNRYVDRRAQ